MGMHFKLGLYEHQSAGAIQGLIDLLAKHPPVLADPAKIARCGSRSTSRRSASLATRPSATRGPGRAPTTRWSISLPRCCARRCKPAEAGWPELMLVPADYDEQALADPLTRQLMARIEFRHGGREYDEKYPDGIPTTLEIEHADLGRLSSGLVMYPEGHARNTSGNLPRLLENKFRVLAGLGVKDVDALYRRFSGLVNKSATEIAALYDFRTHQRVTCHDAVRPVERAQAHGRDLAAHGRPGQAPGQAGQGRPRRHARPLGQRRAGDRHRAGDPAGRIRPANAEALPGQLSARLHEHDRGRRGRRDPARRCARAHARRLGAGGPRVDRRDSAAPPGLFGAQGGWTPGLRPGSAGETVELAARTVQIHRLAIRGYDYPDIELDVECGSGTYVRSLGRDLAEHVGSGAVMTALERTAIGRFALDAAVRPETLTSDNLAAQLIPAVSAIEDLMPLFAVSEADVARLANGLPIECGAQSAEQLAATDHSGRLVAVLARQADGQYRPSKYFPSG